jgi:hypothetical protein
MGFEAQRVPHQFGVASAQPARQTEAQLAFPHDHLNNSAKARVRSI